MEAIAVMALDERHQGQQDKDHGQAAKEPLVPYDLEWLYVQIGHEVVFKSDLGCLHTLHTDSRNQEPTHSRCTQGLLAQQP